jgi:hypothetical protein
MEARAMTASNHPKQTIVLVISAALKPGDFLDASVTN